MLHGFSMGRKAYFQYEDFIDAAIEIISKEGLAALTIAALAKRIQAPVGSLYHRFPSRNALLAEIWLGIIESFQGEFLKYLRQDGLQATLACLQWVRRNPDKARIMLLYHIHDFTSGEWPEEMRLRAERLDGELRKAVLDFTRRQFGKVTRENIDRAAFALHDAPIGLMRRYLRDNKTPPASAAALIREMYDAIIVQAK
jgi:AcrR family transcriptional regulator